MTLVSDPLGSQDGVTMASVRVQGVENMLLKIFTYKLGLHLAGLFLIHLQIFSKFICYFSHTNLLYEILLLFADVWFGHEQKKNNVVFNTRINLPEYVIPITLLRLIY